MGAKQSSEVRAPPPPENLQNPYKIEDIRKKFERLFRFNGKTVHSKPIFEYHDVYEAIISKSDPNLFNIGHRDSITTYRILNSYEEEFRAIIKKITNKNCFKVDRIEIIDNPFLQRAFQLKKQKMNQQGVFVEEKLVFHGTKAEFVDDICNFNFDWRQVVEHKFGKGVSFSPNSTYASYYSDKKRSHGKVMIMAKVLIGQYCLGTPDMQLPPEGCDTSHNDTKQVLVKYEDDDYYPAYKITYHVEGQLNHHRKKH